MDIKLTPRLSTNDFINEIIETDSKLPDICLTRSSSNEDDIQHVNGANSSGYNSNSTLDEQQETQDSLPTNHKNNSGGSLESGSRISNDDSAISLTLDFTNEDQDQDQIPTTQETLLGQTNDTDKNIKHSPSTQNTCLRLRHWLFLSLTVNFLCIVSISVVFSLPRKTGHIETLCVLESNKPPLCSNFSSAHLQYLVHVMQIKDNQSLPLGAAQTYISFHSNKGDKENGIIPSALMNSTKSAHRLVTRKEILSFHDNKIIIRKTNTYFVSVQLLFKRESRLNHTIQDNVDVTLMKKNRLDNVYLLSKTLPICNGSQTLQTVRIVEYFKLKKGDEISILVSKPNLVYKCPTCNMVTVIEIK
ncbi:uncharacterized protein LOC127738365 [Mytilus californianus]|uniref:uncharacterized protein LOC127738365 n=1 Tax=Mytilus californianus TaxID=6549 RepID=UPI0022463EBA|nr:uncharacterized protein LOC127738365 [Mytilus californianus]XP_052105532.1 uncharacterized protein LOC127738365 [Mytilus californianus]XP_052105533.1 uncharacterized protein LOC127738365 [Mytilus californianus]